MAFTDYLTAYWWIFVILGGLLLFFVWRKLDLYTRVKIQKLFSKKVIFVLIAVGAWYYWYKTGGTTTIHVATFWGPLLATVFLAGYNYIGKLQYKSQQLITPNFHGSYAYVREIDGYYIFAIDGFTSDIFNWYWGNRIVIVRKETVQFFDEGAISIARIAEASPYDVDALGLSNAIHNNQYFKGAKDKIFYGWFDDINHVDWEFATLAKLKKEKETGMFEMVKKELGVDNPKVSTLLLLYKNLNKFVNKQTEYFDATVEGVEKGVEHGRRVRMAYDVDEEKERPRPPERAEDYY